MRAPWVVCSAPVTANLQKTQRRRGALLPQITPYLWQIYISAKHQGIEFTAKAGSGKVCISQTEVVK